MPTGPRPAVRTGAWEGAGASTGVGVGMGQMAFGGAGMAGAWPGAMWPGAQAMGGGGIGMGMAAGLSGMEAYSPTAAAAMAGATRARGEHGGAGDPEGSWTCPGCANLNWPKRTSCNRCRVPKPGAQDKLL